MDDDRPRRVDEWRIGEALDEVSVAEIDGRIDTLRAEIVRLEAERERKKGSLDAANAFFR